MFSFIKKKPADAAQTPGTEGAAPDTPAAEESKPEAVSLFARLRQGLSRTRSALSDSLSTLILGRKTIDEDLLEEIETQLLSSDLGLAATDHIIQGLTQKLGRKQLADPQALLGSLKDELTALLTPCDVPLVIDSSRKPYVILVVGVNGAGKTTTIGKLAKRLQQEGHSLMLAAGDTFRAAAVEQLKVWGERNQVPVIAQQTGSDSASVIFDAYQSAKARGVDVLIADTAGRLHNKDNLMQELEKIVRVLRKLDASLPHETLLVLDSTTGQNSLNQARSFHKAVQVTGIALTKLDGTAKGGMVFAIAKEMGLPIRFIGVGEKVDDLRPFEARQFVDALFAE
ncbi:MAG: signal recognition particle-docking protein FtsY [Pseudomonadales bacterium]|nr:signal recognition particle-docking protein FtsY [Pseudomonadales bacterium]MCP5357679.1 signal recognition particle-docking protein FtsY [Pseudomonadales bacterium]